MVLLARCTQFWQQALHIVQPDTLLRWHRDLFRHFWRRLVLLFDVHQFGNAAIEEGQFAAV